MGFHACLFCFGGFHARCLCWMNPSASGAAGRRPLKRHASHSRFLKHGTPYYI
ncbi:hypothetical protein HMPREF9141_1225 [Prevotella multiformis DSM 16608]|uniref:Uncharacterized protein n=1 Tax=Prevotella multiformis DSM 16608 TaxID=888743 RepID=F0F6K3_9BACT|nr:hypothetical protein HMPREF9141_1225 [Prevotella multiformis DSM 16608]